MNPETILRALAHAKPDYLEEAAQEQPKAQARPVRRLLPLIAAVTAVLLATSVAAAVLLGPEISVRKESAGTFDLVLGSSETAGAAPETALTTCCLPTALPEGARMIHASLGEKLVVTYSCSYDFIDFTQQPVNGAMSEAGLMTYVGWSADKVTVQSRTIGDKECTVVTIPHSALGETYDYYWQDEQKQWLMSVHCSHEVPQAAREEFIASVQPVSQREIFEPMGVAEQPVWTFATLPESWETVTGRLEADVWEGQEICVSLEDGAGHWIQLVQGLPEPTPANFTETEREIDGQTVRCLTAYSPVEQIFSEIWLFPADDGQTELQLWFVSQDGEPLPDADKLNAFRSITRTTVQELDTTALNR